MGLFLNTTPKRCGRIDVPVQKQSKNTDFTMVFEKATTELNLIMAGMMWKVNLPIEFKKGIHDQ